jgi:hypothetical protein
MTMFGTKPEPIPDLTPETYRQLIIDIEALIAGDERDDADKAVLRGLLVKLRRARAEAE